MYISQMHRPGNIPGSLWEASGKPPEPSGEDAGDVHLGIYSAVSSLGIEVPIQKQLLELLLSQLINH